jgi:CheY-like chemotaxis protein
VETETPAEILVVDDSQTKRYVLCSWLRRAGHHVIEAATGQEALRTVHEHRVDLVVLDVRLPDTDGFAVCEQIKGDPRTSAVPVIHVSAHAVDVADRTQGLTRGADAYLVEPIDPEELVATIHAVLRYYRARHRAERLAGRLALLVETTTAINATASIPAMLAAAATGASRIFESAAAVGATTPEGAVIAAEVAAPDRPPVARPAATDRAALDPLHGATGTEIRRGPPTPWSPGDIFQVTARVKEGRAPVHLAVPADATSADDRPLLRQLAQAVAVAVEAMRSLDEERRVALTLQRSMLPPHLPRLDGLELAVRYTPADHHAEVGGDFYEAAVVDGELVAAIGDVAGHSLHAATVMAQLRHALRAYVADGHGPGAAIDRLNRLMLLLLPDEFATVALVQLDPRSGRVRLANAGHPPPLLVHDGAVRAIERRVALLGLNTPHHDEGELHLDHGDTLVLFTDGMIEERGQSLDVRLTRLRAAVARVEPCLESFCDRLLAEFGAEPREDDVALLVIRRT